MGEAEGAAFKERVKTFSRIDDHNSHLLWESFRDKNGERVEAARPWGPFNVQRLDGTFERCADGWMVWENGLNRAVPVEEFKATYRPDLRAVPRDSI